jgi:HD-like signal output (HDOD) protein
MSVGFMDIPRDTPVVGVRTTSGRGFTPEELAAQAADRIVSVADSTHPAIRDQAMAYKAVIERLLVEYMKQAVRSDRTTVYNALHDAGQPELAKLIKDL